MSIRTRLPAKQIQRIKYFFMFVLSYLGVQIFTHKVVNAIIKKEGFSGPYVYQGEQFEHYTSTYSAQGYVDEYSNKEDFCTSFVIWPGFSLTNETWQGFAYLLVLCYLFLGIALVADIFMEAIEQITSVTTLVTLNTDSGPITIEKPVWNPTIANLTLMALGSSAPEIILSVADSVSNLDGTPGVLGPMTIVGSAAFNLMVISAVSIMAVQEVKKIFDVRVFAITAVSSSWAYVWFYLVLAVNTPDYVELWEAWLTLGFMLILLVFAYLADRCTNRAVEMEKDQEEKKKDALKAKLRRFQEQYGEVAMINAAYGEKRPAKMKQTDVTDIQEHFKTLLAVDDLKNTDIDELMKIMAPHNPVERIAYRRQFSKFTTHKPEFVAIKGSKLVGQAAIDREGTKDDNPTFGFKHSKYEVSESNKVVNITIVKKVDTDVNVRIRTEDDTAKAPKDYTGRDFTITLKANEKERVISIEINNDAEWEPDKDFKVMLVDEKTGERHAGSDTITTVTILDDESPGILGFEDRFVNVRRMDAKAVIKVTRTEGSDGIVQVRLRSMTADPDKVEGKPALEGNDKDYIGVDKIISFEPNVCEYTETIELPDCKNETTDVHSFAITLEEPSPKGVKLSKKSTCYVNIEPNEGNEEIRKAEFERTKMIEYFIANKSIPYSQHFKIACMLGPTIDDDNLMDDVTCGEAVMHLLTINWKVVFSIIPPKQMWGGWAAFIVALSLIGVITVIVGEVATILGCAIGLKPAVTGITLVAMGTSLPDTFASKTAAQSSKYADSAIGNVTGSNSVNVFLGVGLPWVIGAMYWNSVYGETYNVPAGDLAFSIIMFLACSMGCFLVLVLRRLFVGGELGGPGLQRPISAFIVFSLWLIYIIMCSLRAYGSIEVDI